MSQIHIWSYGSGSNEVRAHAQVHPVPAMALFQVFTGHASAVEVQLSRLFEPFRPFHLHEIDLADRRQRFFSEAAASLGSVPGARYVSLTALCARHTGDSVAIQQLGAGLHLYSLSGMLSSQPPSAQAATADLASRTPGDLLSTVVSLPCGAPLLAASSLLSATYTPDEIATALSGATRYSGDVLLTLCLRALDRRRSSPSASAHHIPLTGTAVLIWPSPGA